MGRETRLEQMKLDLLKMKEAALIYLDRSGGLQKFVNDCKSYGNGICLKLLLSNQNYLA